MNEPAAAPPSPHPDLEAIFRCSDQSALIHNLAASENPPAGAWSHHSTPQSVLGKVSFPEVLTVTRGEVYLFDHAGVISEQMLTQHSWTPWSYDGSNSRISTARSIGPNLFHASIHVNDENPALLLLECVPAAGLSIKFNLTASGAKFEWEDRYDIEIDVIGSPLRILASDDPASLRRRVAGFDDVQLNANHLTWVWEHLHRCWIGIEFTGDLQILFSVTPAGEGAPVNVDGGALRLAERQRWQTFFDRLVPPIRSDDLVVRDSYYFAWQTLWANRSSGGSGELPLPFTSPARLFYGSQWWWDEVFHSAIFRHLMDPAVPYEFLENFYLAQTPDGMIPGCLRFTVDGGKKPEDIGHVTMSMQPPVIGFVLQLLRQKPGWPPDLQKLYDLLLNQARWFDSPARDTDQDGLTEYFHCFETSIDQSQRWDAHKLNPDEVIGPLRPTEAIDLNVWNAILWDVLGDMAEQLGDADVASSHRERGEAIMALVEEFMWDEQDGLYYDIDALSHVKNKVKTPFSFMPLLLPCSHKDRVERMVSEHLTNPDEFWCEFPLCSVSMDTPTFDPIDMFRGATWVNVNWMVIEGLVRQGHTLLAHELAAKTIRLVGPHYEGEVRTRSPRIWEWYHPHTGEALGNDQYSWSALVVDLILRHMT